jgi:hypothetical protein
LNGVNSDIFGTGVKFSTIKLKLHNVLHKFATFLRRKTKFASHASLKIYMTVRDIDLYFRYCKKKFSFIISFTFWVQSTKIIGFVQQNTKTLTPWISVGWHSVGEFCDIKSAEFRSFLCRSLKKFILSVVFWQKICRRYVIFSSEFESVFKKWCNVSPTLCRSLFQKNPLRFVSRG